MDERTEVQAIKEIEKRLKEREIRQQEILVTKDTTLEANLSTVGLALDASLVNEGIALDASLVDKQSTVNSSTSSEQQNECNSSRNECSRSWNENRSSDNDSSSSGNDANVDIGPSYDSDTLSKSHHDIFENIDKEEHDYVDDEQQRAFFASLINNLKCDVEKCTKINREAQQANALLTKFEVPPKVPLKIRDVNLKKHLEQAQLSNYDPKLWKSLLMKYFCYVKHAMLKFKKENVLKQNPPREDVFISLSFEENVKRTTRNRLSDEFEPFVKDINLQLSCFKKGLVKEMKDELKVIVLYIKGKKNGRMTLESIENGPLVYPTIEENGVIRPKKYAELTEQEQLQDDCDVQAINIILSPDVYSLVNHHQVAKDIWDRVNLLMKGDDPIACLNKAMAFMSTVMASYPGLAYGQATQTTITHNTTFQTDDLDAYDSDCDDISLEKAVLMANLSSYDLDASVRFDKVVRVRTTPDAITKGSWGFEHTKKVFLGEVIPVINSLRSSLKDFDNGLHNELNESFIHEYNENLVLKDELAKKEHMVEKKVFNEVVLRCSRLENHCANLELKLQHQKESFLNNRPLNNHDAPKIQEFFKRIEWQAKLNAKDISITNLRKHIESLKGKKVVEKDVQSNNANVIAPGMFRLDLEPLSPKLLKNKDAHIDYIKYTQEHVDTLRELVEHARAFRPLDGDLDSTCRFLKTQDSNKPVLPSTRMKSSTSASRSQPSGNTKKNRISRTTSSNMKNKVEDHPRSVKTNSNKMNRVIEPVCNANVKHSMLNANSELICATCNECMFDAIHDLCVLDFVNDVNVRSKSKSAKSSKKKKIWKPTGKVFTDIGYRWKPTGRTFTIDGNTCPLTRITSTKVVPLKETTSKSVITQNPEIKVYSRRPKVTKSVGSSSKSKIIESRISNNLEPNQYWGSTASNVPSSSLVNFKLSKLYDVILSHLSLVQSLKDQVLVMALKVVPFKLRLHHYIGQTRTRTSMKFPMLMMSSVVFDFKSAWDAHIDYIEHTQENADILWELVEHARALRPFDSDLYSAYKSHPLGNTKKNRISQTTSNNMNNKVEDHPRSVKSNSNKTNRIIEPICNANVKHSMLNANSKLICATYNECMFDAIHDLCVLDFVNDVNVRSKSKSAKSSKKKKIWKPTSKVFTDIRYRWKPTGQTFTIDGNTCPLTRITSTKVVPLKETTSKSVITQNLEIKVYSRRPKVTKSIGSSSKSKIVESRISNNLEPNQSWGSTALNVPSSSLVNFSKFMGTVRFENDHVAKIMGYGDYQMGNVTISWVYYVEGLGHNLFSVGQFCDSDLEVAFRKHTCYIRDLKGVDLLNGSRGSNLYTLSLEDMMLSYPICLLSKASKTKSWLWHR
ncbi:hypothetical protein Tco_1255501, partial [Tanacetum coccineum]